jgi:hypothetical protein
LQKRTRRPAISGEYPCNYLADNLPDTRGVVLLVTSTCPNACEHCNQSPWMRADPRYQMTVEEIDLFCRCAEASDEPIARVDISGGDPLSWIHLRDGITRLNECHAIKSIWAFTSGVGRDEDVKWLADNTDSLRLSRHPHNWRRVRALRRRLRGRRAHIKILDKRRHFPLPAAPVPDTTPGRCGCRAACYTRGRIYACPMIPALVGHGWQITPGLVEDIGPNFVDIRRHLGEAGANIAACARCVANKRIWALSRD